MRKKREAAYRELVRMIGIHEVGPNNRGPEIDKIERDDTLKSPDIGYPWCQSTQNEAWLRATGELLADGTASVNIFHAWARMHGYILPNDKAPEPYDHILYWFSGGWNHVGMIEKVINGGALLHLFTIEGNTGTGDVLESDTSSGRDGVYRKNRNGYSRTSVSIVRVAGSVVDKSDNKVVPHKIPEWTWEWLAWRLGEGAYVGHRLDPTMRPVTAPLHVPAWVWTWTESYLAKRHS